MAETDTAEIVSAPQEEFLSIPEASLVGVARDYADLMAEIMEPPREFFYFDYLACLGHWLGRYVRVASALTTQYQPRLYVVNLGLSGHARKSTAMNYTVGFFEKLRAQGGLFPPVVRGVATHQGLIQKFEENPQNMVVLDELLVLAQQANDPTSVLYEFFATLYDANDFDKPTMKSPVELKDVQLSLGACCTPDTFDTVFSQKAISVGFPNRLWLVPGITTREVPIPLPVPETRMADISRRTLDCVNQILGRMTPNVPVTYPMTVEASAKYGDWYRARPKDRASARLDTYAIRLMLLTALVLGKIHIDEECADLVIPLLDWQYRVRLAYSPSEGENAVARMEGRIRGFLKAQGRIKERGAYGLKKLCHVERAGLFVYQNALANLVRHREAGSGDGWVWPIDGS